MYTNCRRSSLLNVLLHNGYLLLEPHDAGTDQRHDESSKELHL